MMEILLALIVSGLAWVSARLGVVAAIVAATDADHMIKHVIQETYVTCVFVFIMWSFTTWGTGVILFFVSRMLFLMCTDWSTVCRNFTDLKKIVS